jgi:ParB family chromosome partitioning protein
MTIASPNTSIEKLSVISQMLNEAKGLDDIKRIRDIAEAARVYAQAAKLGLESQNGAAEIKIRAERKAGELLLQMPKNEGAKGNPNGQGAPIVQLHDATTQIVPTYASIGIEKTQASRWQMIAKIPIEKFERRIENVKANKEELTSKGMLAVAHVSYNSGENEWYTPQCYADAARETMGGIDVDPASSELANQFIKANKYFSVKDNGLTQEWRGNVWMNPPYVQPLVTEFCSLLVNKFRSNEIKQACVLVNNATETSWYQNMMPYCSAICFIKGRVQFYDKNGQNSNSPLQGQTILYFGDNLEKFISNFSGFGTILYGR